MPRRRPAVRRLRNLRRKFQPTKRSVNARKNLTVHGMVFRTIDEKMAYMRSLIRR